MSLDKVKALCQEHHDAERQPQRWGFATGDGSEITRHEGGCYGSLANHTSLHGVYMWAVFHGDGPVYTLEELSSQKKKMKVMAQSTRPMLKFEGTERSLEWIRFLMSSQSPWKDLHRFMATEINNTWTNNAGFIFTDLKDIPRKLLYNFLMAIRMPWELPESYALWLQLREQFHPAFALYLSSHFWLKEGAKSFDGPYTIVYPWSFLEGLDVAQAKPFISLKPRDISPGGLAVPNVEPLWGTQGPSTLVSKLLHLSEGDKLTLDIIVNEIRAIS